MLRVGVLRFVQDDAIIFLPNSPNDIRLANQLDRKRNLIGIGDDAALKTEIAISALHLRRDTKRAGVHPVADRLKGAAPMPNEFSALLDRSGQGANSVVSRQRSSQRRKFAWSFGIVRVAEPFATTA